MGSEEYQVAVSIFIAQVVISLARNPIGCELFDRVRSDHTITEEALAKEIELLRG